MKKTLLIQFILFSVFIYGQEKKTQTVLEYGNVRAHVSNSGQLFQNISNYSAGFEVPINSGKTSLYSSSLWIGGKSPNGQVYTAATYFSQSDFIPGPILDSAHAAERAKYNKIWFLTCQDIETFIEYYKCWKDPMCIDTLNFPNYSIPEAIATWPANQGDADWIGNAPYMDVNKDGVYNHLDGDFPVIRGEQFAFFILNDEGEHFATGSEPMGLEIMVSAYVGNDDNFSEALENTVYVHYDIVNQGPRAYADMYLGVFADFDLGDPSDNFIGSLPNSNAFYAYNGDGFDEQYQDTAVAMGVAILGGPYMDADGSDNVLTTIPGQHKGLGFSDDFIDNERLGLSSFLYYGNGGGISGDPLGHVDHYNYIRSTWRDGSSVVYGGLGSHLDCEVPFSCNDAVYMYPGDDDIYNIGTGEQEIPWDEASAGNTPGYRRGVGATGPFTMKPGASQVLDLAYVFASKKGDDNKAAIPVLKQFIEDLSIPSDSRCARIYDSVKEIKDVGLTLECYPNPAKNAITLKAKQPNFKWRVLSIIGQELLTGYSKNLETTVDVHTLTEGTYVLQVLSHDQVINRKIQVIR